MPEELQQVIESAPSASVAPAPTATPPAAEPKEVSLRESLEANLKAQAAPEQKAPPAPEAKPAEVKPPEARTPEQQAQEQADLVKAGRMPRNWKGGLDRWHSMDPVAKDHILRREREYAQGIETYRTMAQAGQSIMAEFQPYEELLRSLNASPQQAANYLLGAYARLVTGNAAEKAHFIAELARENGVDLQAIVTNGLPQIDPEYQQLKQSHFELAARVRQQNQQQQQAETAEINRLIDEFASDPKNEHFNTVRPVMAALLGNGQAKDLQTAYDMACWADASIRASLVNRQQAEAAEQRKKAAEAAQQAAVSVAGAPPAPTVTPADNSLRGTLQRAFAQHGGRV